MWLLGIIALNGLIEGLTEFIPVSSTGHLIILNQFFPLTPDIQSDTFQIAIQAGAMCAALVYYRRFFYRFFSHIRQQKGLFLRFLCGTLPLFIMGFLCHDSIKHILFNPIFVALALCVGGIAMIVTDRLYARRPQHNTASLYTAFSTLTYRQALIIGAAHVLALWPGMSRSGSSILGGVWAGLSYKTATDISFCMGIPVVFAAVAYDCASSLHALSHIDVLAIIAGAGFSYVVGLFAITTVLRWVSKWHLAPFGWYRLLLGTALLIIL